MLNCAGMQIEVRRKKIKHLHLYVKPPNGSVMVTAPLSMSDEVIERFVLTKAAWLQKHVAKFVNQPCPVKREYKTGETLTVWGKQYVLQICHGTTNSLALIGDTAVLTVRRESTASQREKFVREWYRGLLKAEIARLLPPWEKATGLKASGWQTKDMTTRWGTCNTKTGKIWISLQLVKKPPECLAYVILHELVHLIEGTHNKRFQLKMDRYMPAWRAIKAALNNKNPGNPTSAQPGEP